MGKLRMIVWVGLLMVLVGVVEDGPPEANAAGSGRGGAPVSHAGKFAHFSGAPTCLRCHRKEAVQVHSSVHYQWKGDSRDTVNLGGKAQGKMTGLNDFCIYAPINWLGLLKDVDGNMVDGGCARCHAGLGRKPESRPSPEQLANIDCLVCHAEGYRRKVAKVGEEFRLVPDLAKMSSGIDAVAQSVARPTKAACLSCHARSGGGNNFKRGDLEEAMADPPRELDVHMASRKVGGAGLDCVACHRTEKHRIPGRGSDLVERDTPRKVACTNCHRAAPHKMAALNRHVKKVNCTVCHVPTFARGVPTDMVRDWSKPAEVDPVKKLYDPHMVKESRVLPEYAFFNGTSTGYACGIPVDADEKGIVSISRPCGAIEDDASRIFAFKVHHGVQPIDARTGKLLPLKIGVFFQTGDLVTAIQEGVKALGWPEVEARFARTVRYMGLFHQVAPKQQALRCKECHGGGRMPFGELGYRPVAKVDGTPLCAICHSPRAADFYRVHDQHLRKQQFECGRCHSFPRQ